MKKSILGEYNFINNTAINFIDNSEEEINATILHETIHMLLTKQTIWGMACYLIRKVLVYDNSYEHILQNLCTHTRKVQESTAVFFECIYIIRTKGYNKFLKYLEYLNTSNKEYYGYIVPLVKFLRLLEPNSEIKIEAYELSTLILTLSKIALNSNLTEIELEKLKKKKLFKKFISNEENVKKYIPNKRFKAIADIAYTIIKENRELKIDDIIEKINFDMYYKNEKIEINDEDLAKLKEYFKEMHINSKRLEEISIYFETVRLVEINVEDLPKYSLPHSFSEFSSGKSCYKDIFNYAKNKLGILFYLGNLENMDKFDSNILFVPKEYIEIIKKELGERINVMVYYDYMEKKVFPLNVSKSESQELINIHESTVVVNYKVYDIEKDDIIGINTDNKSIFIYCDRTYPNSIDLINKIAKEKCKARIIEYKNMYLLVIRVSNKTKFILPFVGIAYYQVRSDIDSGKLNIELADNPDRVTETDNYILKTEDSVEQYDLIINCLFQIY